MTRRPQVGDDVLYVSFGTPGGEYGHEIRAAKVTSVGMWVTVDDSSSGDPNTPRTAPMDGLERTLRQVYNEDAVTLFVMNPTGLFLDSSRPARYHSGRDLDGVFVGWLGGSWHWPNEVFAYTRPNGPIPAELTRYDNGVDFPAGVTIATNNTAAAEEIIPAGVLACPYPLGVHSDACDWRMHLKMIERHRL